MISRLLLKLYAISVSPVTFVVLAIVWCFDLAVGSILAYQRDPQFWTKMDAVPFSVWLNQSAPAEWPHSWWVYLLVGLTYLMVVSLLLCSINWLFFRSKQMKAGGEVLVHLGFMLIFAGFVLGAGFGVRVQGVRVLEGREVEVAELGVSIDLKEVYKRVDDDGEELDTLSWVTVTGPGDSLVSGTLRLNHPLIRGATVVYPRGATNLVMGMDISIDGSAPQSIKERGHVLVTPETAVVLRNFTQEGQRMGPYEGRGAIIGLIDKSGRNLGTGFLPAEENATVTLGRHTVTAAKLHTRAYGIYDIHRDPGVLIVLAGTIFLGLGTVWALTGYLGLFERKRFSKQDHNPLDTRQVM